MTAQQRAMRARAREFETPLPASYSARCGRVLRRTEAAPPAEPDAKPIDRVIAAGGVIGIAVFGIAYLIERLAA
jgi:hypothetical protein